MDCEIALVEPTPGSDELTPGGNCDLVLEYTNTGAVTHRVESVLIEPTWNLSERRSADIGNEVPAGASRELTTIRTVVPEGLAGRHGFRIGVKTQALTDDTESDDGPNSKTIWMDSIRRFEVAGTNRDEYRALVCFSEGDDEYQLINQLLKDYGYDPDFIESHEELISQEKPTLVLGVVLSESVNLVSSAMTWASPDDVEGSLDVEELDGDGTGDLVVQHADVSLDELSGIAMDYQEVNTFDRLVIERAVGHYLFKVRLLDKAGVLEYIYELADALQTNPKDLIDSWSNAKIIELIETVATRERIIKAFTAGSGFIAGSEVGAGATKESEQKTGETDRPEILQYFDNEGADAVVNSNRVNEIVLLFNDQNPSLRIEAAEIIRE
jgi:hypothetical protein